MNYAGSVHSAHDTTAGLEKESMHLTAEDYGKEYCASVSTNSIADLQDLADSNGHSGASIDGQSRDRQRSKDSGRNDDDDLSQHRNQTADKNGSGKKNGSNNSNEIELDWSVLKQSQHEAAEDERLRLLLADHESDTNEDLSNLADIVPGLVTLHRSMMYQGSGHGLVASSNKAYSSKVLDSVHRTTASPKQHTSGDPPHPDILSLEIPRSKEMSEALPVVGEHKDEDQQSDSSSVPPSKQHQHKQQTPSPVLQDMSRMDEAASELGPSRSEDDLPLNSGEDLDDSFSGPLKAFHISKVIMPESTDTFKPASGCKDASDFIVRCFVARLRSGMTVVKHAHSRWAKSQLRTLHVHEDGRSLTWKPALGERKSSKKKRGAPKLDLRDCTEVRHAWTLDPLNPSFTGTRVLRLKCEPENAHKSFALVFPDRTVDITAMTADQCRVLMEGFSALCYRLQMVKSSGKSLTGSAEELLYDDKATETETMTTKSGAQHSKTIFSVEIGH